MNLFNSFFGGSVPLITVQDLNEKMKAGQPLFLLDVREPQEFRQGHIAGAKLIPLGELEKRINEVSLDREIVCICASGQRSEVAVQILKAAGHTAASMKNGMIAWQMARLPIQNGSYLNEKQFVKVPNRLCSQESLARLEVERLTDYGQVPGFTELVRSFRMGIYLAAAR